MDMFYLSWDIITTQFLFFQIQHLFFGYFHHKKIQSTLSKQSKQKGEIDLYSARGWFDCNQSQFD